MADGARGTPIIVILQDGMLDALMRATLRHWLAECDKAEGL